jgi:hypothetical protein
VEKVSPFLLHLPEDMKPEDLFNCISQVRNVPIVCVLCIVLYLSVGAGESVDAVSMVLDFLLLKLERIARLVFQLTEPHYRPREVFRVLKINP